jgi:hypothetical protein
LRLVPEKELHGLGFADGAQFTAERSRRRENCTIIVERGTSSTKIAFLTDKIQMLILGTSI